MGSGLRRRAAIAACAAVSMVALCGATARGSAAVRAEARPAGSQAATVSVTATAITRAIRPDFLGLALEFSTVPYWVGSGRPDPVLVRLIRNLAPAGRPMIRIGGLSTDRSWWPAPGVSRPAGVTYSLTPDWAQRLTALARTLDARLILGINLEADSRRVAQAEARNFVATIPRRYLAALDIGNEPPLYTSVPWYRMRSGALFPWYSNVGAAVFSRGVSWGPRAFQRDYARTLAAMPRISIAGPDTQRPSWFAAYRRFLSPRSRVRILASHGYGLNSCVLRQGRPAYPSLSHLLSRYAIDDLLPGLTPYVALAHRNHATYRIDEMGSITCNGRTGVSDTMASALWAASALFQAARDGVDGVNLHTYPGLPNALYDIHGSAGEWSAAVHPLYYGALLFARAAPAGSRLVTVSAHGPTSLRAWATTGPGRARHVLLVNVSPSRSAVVRVRVRSDRALGVAGQVQRLSAPGVGADAPIDLGGRTFGAVTLTGSLRPAVRAPVRARRGTFRISVPAGSAALLTLTAPDRH